MPKKGNLANLTLRSRLEVALIERDGSDCFYCGRTRDEVWRAGLLMAIDHVVPSPEGSDDIDNLVWACSECNIRKCLQPGWFFMLKTHVAKLADAPRNILVSFGRFRLHDFGIQQRSLPEPPESEDSLHDTPHSEHLAVELQEAAKQAASEDSERRGRNPEDAQTHKEKGSSVG